jgi:putative aldouronate transport system permease protein
MYRIGVGGRVFELINGALMVILCVVMLYPFWNQLILSFNQGADAVRGGIYFWPRVFSTQAYEYIITNSQLPRGALISILRVAVGTVTGLVFTGLLSYVVTIRHFSGRRFLRTLYVVTLYFGGGLIPVYLLIVRLHLTNTFTVYWLPNLVDAYYMLIISSFMQSVPESLNESARLDGARELTIFFRIMLPVSTPVFAAIAVFAAVGHWNSWFDVLIYNPSGKWDTLTIYLRKILLQIEQLNKLQVEQARYVKYRSLAPITMRAATTMIVTLPIVFTYPFLQRYFIKGITLGAVKQ